MSSPLLRRYDPHAPKVTRERAGVVEDSYGDETESWHPDHVERLPLPGAHVEDRDVVEDEGTVRRVVRREKALFAPGAPDVTHADRIRVGEDVWRVDGDPVVRRGLASGTFTTATLVRVTG